MCRGVKSLGWLGMPYWARSGEARRICDGVAAISDPPQTVPPSDLPATSVIPKVSQRASGKSVDFCRCLPCFHGWLPSRGAAMFRHDPVGGAVPGHSISCAIISSTCSMPGLFFCSISSAITVSVPCLTIPFSFLLVIPVTEPALALRHSIFAFLHRV